MITADQYDLLNRSAGPWLTLRIIADFNDGRSHAVAGQGGGTHHFADGNRGQYETTVKGMAATSATRRVEVTWTEARRWVDSLPASARERAATLQREGLELHSSYPSPYPGIGRAYCWDSPDGCTPDQRQRDLDDLAEAHRLRDLEIEAWQTRRAEHDNVVRSFLASLRPDDEPADLLDLLEALG